MKIKDTGNHDNHNNHKGPKIPNPPSSNTVNGANEQPNPTPNGPKKPWYKRVWVWVIGIIILIMGFSAFSNHSLSKPKEAKPATAQSASSSSMSSSSMSSSSYKIPKFKQTKKNTVDMKPLIEKLFTAYQVQPNPKSMDYAKRMKLMREYADQQVVDTLIPDSTVYQYNHEKKHYIVQTKLRKPIQILPVDGEQTGTYVVNISYQNYRDGDNFTHDQTDKYSVNTDHNKIVGVQLLKSHLDN